MPPPVWRTLSIAIDAMPAIRRIRTGGCGDDAEIMVDNTASIEAVLVAQSQEADRFWESLPDGPVDAWVPVEPGDFAVPDLSGDPFDGGGPEDPAGVPVDAPAPFPVPVDADSDRQTRRNRGICSSTQRGPGGWFAMSLIGLVLVCRRRGIRSNAVDGDG